MKRCCCLLPSAWSFIIRSQLMTQAWAAKGVEVLQGNLLDRPFLDRAMAGVDMLFLVTFSDHDGTEVCVCLRCCSSHVLDRSTVVWPQTPPLLFPPLANHIS